MSEGPQYDDEEIRQYNVEDYELFQTLKSTWLLLNIGAPFLLLALAGAITQIKPDPPFGIVGLVFVLLLIVGVGIYFKMQEIQGKAREAHISAEKRTARDIEKTLRLQRSFLRWFRQAHDRLHYFPTRSSTVEYSWQWEFHLGWPTPDGNGR